MKSYRKLIGYFASVLIMSAVCSTAYATSPSSGTTTFGSGGNDVTLASGAGNSGVTAADVAGTGWNIRVQTTTGTSIMIARGDLFWGTGDGVYYTDGAGDGELMSSFRVTSNDGKIFDLKSLKISTSSTQASGTTQVTVTGLLGGSAVSGATANFNLSISANQSNLEMLDVSADPDFVGVDGFQITSSSGADVIFVGIDDIDVANVRSADSTPPTVTSVSVPSNATYIAGQSLSFTVNTSENVTVNTGGGTPRIALTIGGTTKYATYASGSGSSALVFSYSVESGLLDSDGITVGALNANGGTLRDAANNA